MAIQIPNPGTGNGASGDNEFVLWSKVKDNFSDQTNAASRLVGEATGNAMEVGAFGLGARSAPKYPDTTHPLDMPNGFFQYMNGKATNDNIPPAMSVYATAGLKMGGKDGSHGSVLFLPYYTSDNAIVIRSCYNYTYIRDYVLWHNNNTTKDANGFLKGASPVVDMYDNKIDLNQDAEQQGGITFEKLGVGDYLIKGSLGFAQEGWYIEMPKDANGNVLVAVVYKQLANNDLSIKTYAKKFDDETGDIVANLLKPRDIPVGRFISLRLHELPKEPPVMPDDIQTEEVTESGK